MHFGNLALFTQTGRGRGVRGKVFRDHFQLLTFRSQTTSLLSKYSTLESAVNWPSLVVDC